VRLNALFRLAFATATAVTALTLPHKVTRRLILQKARRQAFSRRSIALRPLVSIRFQVLFHSPNRGSFNLSLTVLVRYRSPRVFSLGKWASLLPAALACAAVLKVIDGSPVQSCTGLSPSLAGLSSALLLPAGFVTPLDHRRDPVEPYNPHAATAAAFSTAWV
jgi:hypothetical protein